MRKVTLIVSLLLLVAVVVPALALAQAPPECEFEYTVQKDDWLSKIAEKYYGDMLAYDRIADANNASADDTYVAIEDVDLIEPGWLLCIPPDGEPSTGPQAAPAGLSPDVLANATYKSEWTQEGSAPLTNGEYSEAVAPGSATQTKVTLLPGLTAYGQLNGQDAAAAVLVTNPGGSGTFYDLAVVQVQGGQPVNVATTNLGDRVEINSIEIKNNQIQVDMVTQGPDDPMCCPTQRVVKAYALQGEQLMETSSQVVSGQAGAEAGIVDIVWNWQGFSDQSERNDIVVPNPDSYRLQLLPDGTYQFKADCNTGSGGYTLEGNSLSLGPYATTLAECGPGSLYNEYLSLLGQVVTFVREGDNLFLNLVADAGNMKFSKLQAVTGRIVAPEGSTLPQGAQVEVKVEDVSLADAPATQVGGQLIFDVRGFPIDFEATYNPQAIQPNHTYGLQVTIQDSQGKLLFTNTTAYNVMSQGNPTYNVEVLVEPVN